MAVACRCVEPLDREKLLEDCDDETSFANRCLQVFVTETQADIDGIVAALGSQDFAQVARLAHRIKGAAASIRAAFLQDEAAQLHLLGDSAQAAEAALCFSRLREEFNRFKQFIAALPPLSD